jgi:hypothetical protein
LNGGQLFSKELSEISAFWCGSFIAFTNRVSHKAVRYCDASPASDKSESGMRKAFEKRRMAADCRYDLILLSHHPVCNALDTHFKAVFGTGILFFSEPDWLASSCLCLQYRLLAFWQVQSPACRCLLKTYMREIVLQPDSLSMERVSANASNQILQNEVVTAFGHGQPWLRWANLQVDVVPPETISEDVQLLHGFMGNLADSQKRFDDETKTEILKASLTNFVHRAVDRRVRLWKCYGFSSSEVPRIHFNTMRNQRVQTQGE